MLVGLEEICNAQGLTCSDVYYYQFQHSYANRLMIIMKSAQGTGRESETCNVNIPSEFTIYEGSWSYYANQCYDYVGWSNMYSYFLLDGSQIVGHMSTAMESGQLTVAQLSSDVSHTVSLSCPDSSGKAHVSIVLVYSET